MPKLRIIHASILLLLSSCSGRDEIGIATYTVERGDFQNVLVMEGFTEPTNFGTVTCPMDVMGAVEWLIEDGTYVEEGDLICRLDWPDLKSHYDQLVTSIEEGQANLFKQKAELEMQYALLEAQVRNNQAQTKIAELDSLQLSYLTPNERRIRELELQQTAIEKNKFDNKLKTLEIVQQSDIRKMEIQNRQMENEASSYKDRLDRLVIRAPRAGMVIISNFRGNVKIQVGDNLWPGTHIARIPEFDRMKINLTATEAEFKHISVGDSISYTFNALPGTVGWGKVTQKTPIGRPYKEGSKVKVFDLEASLDSVDVMPEPGLTTNCRIFIREVKDTIIIPQVALFDKDSMKVVYVKHPKRQVFEIRQVETGIASAREIIITKGLQAGETITLIEPRSSLVKTTTTLPEEEQAPADSTANDSVPTEDPPTPPAPPAR